jgi:hypothetical protein
MLARPALPSLAAGVLLAATAAVDIPHVQPASFRSAPDYVLEVLLCLSVAAGAVALWLLAARAESRAARRGLLVPAAGHALLTVATAATAGAGRNVLGPVFLLGLLLTLVGAVVVLVLDLRRRLTPRGVGIALCAGTLAMVVLGDGYGLVGWSAGWVAVAAVLRQSEVTTTSTRWNSLSSV